MDCERIRDLVDRAAGDALTESDRRAVESHAAGCTACEDYKGAARFAERAFAAVELEPFPDHRSQKIMTLVRELPAPGRSFWTRLAEWMTPRPQWAYAALPAMAVGLLFLWPRGDQPVGPRDTNPVAPPVQIATAPELLGTIESRGFGTRVGARLLGPKGRTELRAGEEIRAGHGGAMLAYADGTRLELDGRAVAGRRSLELLEGRALAAVTKTGAGFRVNACRFQVQVMGTRFSVDANRCEVQLLEGKVRTSAAGLSTDLLPGEAVRHSGLRADRRMLSVGERRELVMAFVNLEGTPAVAGALGLTEDALRAMVRPPEPPSPSSTSKPEARPRPVQPSLFNPLQGLRNKQ